MEGAFFSTHESKVVDPATKLVGVQVKKEKEKFTVMGSHLPQNLEFGHFTSLFCSGRQRNILKCITRVQGHCFCSFNLLFCGVRVQ